MKKLLYVFSALALIFTSCSSDSDSSSDDVPAAKLTRIVETFGDSSTETTEFTYNGNKIVKSVSDAGEETQYTYTGDLITETKSYLNGYLEERVTYEYDSSLRLIRSTVYYDISVLIDNFTYNANNTVSFTTTSGTEIIATGLFYLAGNQPFKKEMTNHPGTVDENISIQENTFDNKNNPMKNITGLAKLELANPSYMVGFSGVFNNSIMLKVDNATVDASVYTYNSSAYPVSNAYDDYENDEFDSTSQYFYE